MKKINLTTILLLTAVITFTACKKNKEDQQSSLKDKIKKIVHTNSDGSITENNLLYDNSGRLVKFSSGTITAEYSYEPGKVITKTIHSNGNVFTSVGELNSRGFLTTLSGDGSLISYAINSSGYVEKEVLTNFTNGHPTFVQTRNYFYNQSTGLLDSSVLNVGGSKSTTIYTAFTNKPDNYFKNIGSSFIAPSLKYLPAEFKTRSGNNNAFSFITYTYEFDAKGRVSRRTGNSSGKITTSAYLYYD